MSIKCKNDGSSSRLGKARPEFRLSSSTKPREAKAPASCTPRKSENREITLAKNAAGGVIRGAVTLLKMGAYGATSLTKGVEPAQAAGDLPQKPSTASKIERALQSTLNQVENTMLDTLGVDKNSKAFQSAEKLTYVGVAVAVTVATRKANPQLLKALPLQKTFASLTNKFPTARPKDFMGFVKTLPNYSAASKAPVHDFFAVTGTKVRKLIIEPIALAGTTMAAGTAAVTWGAEASSGVRKQGTVSKTNVLAELAALRANPQDYMSQNYHGFDPVREISLVTGRLKTYAGANGEPVYFRRVPLDLYNAYKEHETEKGRYSEGQPLIIHEPVSDRKGRSVYDSDGRVVTRPVELKSPFWSNPKQDMVWMQSAKAEGSKGWSGSARTTILAVGPIEGLRSSIEGELTHNYRYTTTPNGQPITTIRAAFPTRNQQLGIGVRQQSSDIWSRIAGSINPVAVNPSQVKDLDRPSGPLHDTSYTVLNLAGYLDLGNRSRLQATTKDLVNNNPFGFARYSQETFAEGGISSNIARMKRGDHYISANVYYEIQQYPAYLSLEANTKRPDKTWYQGSGLQTTLPVPEVDIAGQLSTNMVPAVTTPAEGLNLHKPWKAEK